LDFTVSWILYNVGVLHAFFNADLLISIFPTFALIFPSGYPFQQQKFRVDEVYQLYPEYYILKVNDFNRWLKVPMEQWLYFLGTSEIPDDVDAPVSRKPDRSCCG